MSWWIRLLSALSFCCWLLGSPLASGARARGDSEDSRTHVVEPGEAVWTIAQMYGVSVDSIREANPELDLDHVRPGDELTIVGSTRSEAAVKKARRALSKRAHRGARARARRLELGTFEVAAKLYRGRPREEWVRAAGRPDRTEGSLRWPVQKGWFVRGFGSGAGGYHQAVDIGGEIGWPVRAAASGIVGYAGDEIDGYGNLVILIHRGGWVTLYGHNSKNLVVAGQRVRRGQIIAELGSTGKSRGPHVHFELLFEGENCNPATLFRPGMRNRDGSLRNVRRRFWNRPDRKPRAIRCHPRKHHPDTDA